MDLHSMLNDGPAPEKKPSQPQASSPPPTAQHSPPLATPNRPVALQGHSQAQTQSHQPPGANGSHPPAANAAIAAGFPPPRPDQKPPQLYTSHSGSAGPQSRGLTPLRTPGGSGSGSGSYPFPQQQQQMPQSPATAGSHPPPPHQYRPYESTVTTPGGRPPSHGYSYPQPSPSPYGPGMQAHQHHSSQSPTPSSHHSQTPHSLRQSPLATIGHPQSQGYQPSHQLHHSQQPTPLGPPQPPQHVPRHPQVDVPSPYHQRTWSGASNNGLVAGSPAQHHPSIGSLVESPGASQYRNSPQKPSASDYQRQSQERERSVSVSPKTKIPPRPPSLGSRHSSQHEIHSARSSLQPSASVGSLPDGQMLQQQPSQSHAPIPSQMPLHMYAQSQSQPQQPFARPASDVPQSAYPQTSRPSPGVPVSHSLLDNNKAAIQHQPLRVGMNQLLAPTQHDSSAQNGFPRQSPIQTNGATAPLVPSQMAVKAEVKAGSTPASTTSQKSLKRSATNGDSEPPTKREKRRKYTERPVWANLNPSNPRHGQAGSLPNSRTPNAPAPPLLLQNSTPAPPPPLAVHGHSHVNGPIPVDEELAKMRRIKGAWEKSFAGTVSLPDIPQTIADWLHGHLSMSFRRDGRAGLDPRDGTLEIEAKIGRIQRRGRDERLTHGVCSITVLDPKFADNEVAFESEMNEREHKHMNTLLNNRLVESARRDQSLRPEEKAGLQKIQYTHLRETDHFRKLSKAGKSALPQTIPIERLGHEPNLRTTVDDKTKQVTARIIKVKLGNLHILNPRADYDLRITVSIECNLMRDGLDDSGLTEEPEPGKSAQPPRKKDRMSYKHLDYQIDLTRVDTPGLAPKYELELEVDASALQTEMARIQAGQEDGFVNIVEGFWENAKWLMKQRVPQEQH